LLKIAAEMIIPIAVTASRNKIVSSGLDINVLYSIAVYLSSTPLLQSACLQNNGILQKEPQKPTFVSKFCDRPNNPNRFI